MIRAGREVVVLAEIAALHGLNASQAKRRKPWAQQGHPQPVSTRRASNGYPTLWDREQARAYADGAPIPPLPEVDDELDLLDRFDAAKLAGVHPAAWEQDWHQGRGGLPPADDERHGVALWQRRTVLAHREQRTAPRVGPHPGGRPPGSPPRRPVGHLAETIAALLADAAAAGERVTVREVARRAAVSYSTAHRHVTALRSGSTGAAAPVTGSVSEGRDRS